MTDDDEGEGRDDWPSYTYVPGGPNPHPRPDRVRPPIIPARPRAARASPAYVRGILLFNAGFYWEAHEVWEGLWHAHQRRGPVADALKGLIKLAAAGVKVREHRPIGVSTHLARAADCFDSAHNGAASEILDLDLADLALRARRLALDPPASELPTPAPPPPRRPRPHPHPHPPHADDALTPPRPYALLGKTRTRSIHPQAAPTTRPHPEMHIPDMILSGRVTAVTAAVAAAGLGVALVKVRRHLGERVSVLTGVVAAFVFVAQMVNFPVGPGVSGHLMGGVLAAVLVGPWAGAVAIAAVLIVQCLLFGDGGLTALGANFLNMGLIGSVLGYAIYAPIRRAIGGRNGTLIAAMLAAWLVVVLAAASVSIQLAASTSLASLPRIFIWMMLVHAVIGVGEALITGLVIRFVLLVRPDFLFEPDTVATTRPRRLAAAAAGLGIALAVAVILAPLAWTTPDGLEFVGARLGIEPADAAPLIASPFTDYEMPGLAGRFGLGAATAAAGVVGTLIVFAASLVLARALRPAGIAPPDDDPRPIDPEPAHAA